MAKTRTFIAADPSPEVRLAALALGERLAPHAPGFRWSPADNLHYTLQFLGDISDQDVADVCRRVGRVAADFEPFSLQSLGVGAFPSSDRPRTVWVGAGQGSNDLVGLQQEIEAELDGMGFRGENRRYVPHLTIGKAGKSGRPAAELPGLIAELPEYDAGVSLVSGITVYASELLRDGPEYHVLATCPLGG